MSSSSHYYRLYNDYKRKVKNCNDDIKEIERIKISLNNDFYDEQRNVNSELEELKSDLAQAVRHNSKFDETQRDCDTYEEKTTNADQFLKQALSEIEEGLVELQRKRDDYEYQKDTYYSLYQQAKVAEEMERQAREAERQRKLLEALSKIG